MRHGLGILYPDTEFPQVPVAHWRLWDIGVTWKDINTGPEVYDYSRLDRMIELGRSKGINSFLLVLGMTPQWAARNPNSAHAAPWIGAGSNSPPADIEVWKKYVIHTVNRYKGVVSHYQIWNEPQLADFWFPYTQIPLLGRMTAEAKRLAGLIDPSAKIVAAPVLPRPSSGGMKRASRYLRELRKHKWPVDVFSAHIYPEKNEGSKRWEELAGQVQATLRELKAPKRPLWITETNYNLLGGPIDPRLIDPYMKQTDLACKRLGIDRVYWYAYGSHTNPQTFGIPFTAESQGTRSLVALNA